MSDPVHHPIAPPRTAVFSDRGLRRWAPVGGSVLLHAGLLTALLFTPSSPDSDHPEAHLAEVTPYGRGVAVDVDWGAFASEAAPHTPPSPDPPKAPQTPPAPQNGPPPAPELPASPAPERRRTAPRPRAEAAPPSDEPVTAETEAPAQRDDAEDSEGEDWIGIDRQLDEREPEVAALVVTASPGRDPLVERLMAAEARKAAARETAPRAGQLAPAQPPPAKPPRAPASTRSVLDGVSDLPVGLVRWLSDRAPLDPSWDRVKTGTRQVQLRVELARGRIERFEFDGSVASDVERAVTAAFFTLRQRQFDGGGVHPANGEILLTLTIRVSQLDAASYRGSAPPVLNHETTSDGRYLPRAWVVLPSLRKIALSVGLRPNSPQ